MSAPKDLLAAAEEARKLAYSPYSGFKVGAAVRGDDGRIYSGCNVENSSYGATLCAERVAIAKAVSSGARRITEVLVSTEASPPWPPCGMCRQVITEFADDGVAVHLANPRGEGRQLTLGELFPEAFRLRP